MKLRPDAEIIHHDVDSFKGAGSVDANPDAKSNFEKLALEYSSLPETMKVLRDDEAVVVFFSLPENFNSQGSQNNLGAYSGIHLQAGRGPVFVSKLRCPEGAEDLASWIDEAPLAQLPDWVLSLANNGQAKAVAPFPNHVFPTPVARLIKEGSESLACPMDFFGIPALAVLGTAIGTSRQLELKPDWREQAVIFAGVIADPGAKKPRRCR